MKEEKPIALAVIYLARRAEGLTPFTRFVESYRYHRAGADHSLVITLKGFPDKASLGPYQNILQEICHQEVRLGDDGLDLTAYFETAKCIDAQAYCFLNTFSRILSADWLEKLASPLDDPGVGLVGATGSYESPSTNYSRSNPNAKLWEKEYWIAARYRYFFDPFPNPHIRTNAFLLRRGTLEQLKIPRFANKMSAYRFESGRRGLTKQIKALGLKAVLAGRNGETYEEPSWPQSRTFRSGNQDNLIIADNQTDLFKDSDGKRKSELSRLAWEGRGSP